MEGKRGGENGSKRGDAEDHGLLRSGIGYAGRVGAGDFSRKDARVGISLGGYCGSSIQ